jgi:anthranilate synthase component 2
MILMIDNYDSFTYNLVQELAEIGAEPIEVVRNDEATAAALLARRPRAIVISPGPGTPHDSGISLELIAQAADIPLLGICLGLQALAQVHGGKVVRAPEPVHGKTSEVRHDGRGLFEGVPEPMVATRYHSLVVEAGTVPECFERTAWTDDGLVMALAHRERPHWGVQFHPESYLCRDGMTLLGNFLRMAGVGVSWVPRRPPSETRTETERRSELGGTPDD